ncbi:MAG: trans-2-enoyl-CoA reductase, partial [Verrucomicrobia bacterium]|nr:trans-2-enoyl-CoA reductase [Verrucomicrobiota bacterium]
FWISKWYGEASRGEIGEMLAEIFRLSISGVITVPVEGVYALADVKLALERAACGERSGKILFGGGKV